MSIELISGLHNMRSVLRTGIFGQREVWERHLEQAAAALAARDAELAAAKDMLTDYAHGAEKLRAEIKRLNAEVERLKAILREHGHDER